MIACFDKRKRRASLACLVFACLLFALPAVGGVEAFDHEHSAWNLLLKNNVRWNLDHTASQVDYTNFQKNRIFLGQYLDQLSAVSRMEFDSFGRNQQLAFLLNAYNAFTVELILSEYPAVKSIKELGSFFSSPWKKKFFRLFGKSQSLDGIEHDLIRGSGRYNEPLIHFAVNCASVGCPALQDEAFIAERLDSQLLESTRLFLKDRTRNRFDSGTATLEISSIFKWYAEDFTRGWRGYDSLADFFRVHADWVADDAEGAARLVDGTPEINFLEYDWALNSFR